MFKLYVFNNTHTLSFKSINVLNITQGFEQCSLFLSWRTTCSCLSAYWRYCMSVPTVKATKKVSRSDRKCLCHTICAAPETLNGEMGNSIRFVLLYSSFIYIPHDVTMRHGCIQGDLYLTEPASQLHFGQLAVAVTSPKLFDITIEIATVCNETTTN